MIIPANERLELRERIARTALDLALSMLCNHEEHAAMDALQRSMLAIEFLDVEDDVPDWVLNSTDLLNEVPP